MIGLYYSRDNKFNDLFNRNLKKKFLTFELNYVEFFNHLCREKGIINSQIIMENIRKQNLIEFLPFSKNVSIIAGELKCKYRTLSIVDAIISAEAFIRKSYNFTMETHLEDVKNLKLKKN